MSMQACAWLETHSRGLANISPLYRPIDKRERENSQCLKNRLLKLSHILTCVCRAIYSSIVPYRFNTLAIKKDILEDAQVFVYLVVVDCICKQTVKMKHDEYDV